MYDLFQIARENAPSLESRLTAVMARMSPKQMNRLEQFIGIVRQQGAVSINMRPWALSSLLGGSKWQDIHEWAREIASVSGKSADMLMRQRLGGWYHRRVSFDKSFVNGERFRSGALNIGGAGPVRYGQFCVVLKPDFPPVIEEIAYLKTDSLSYVDSSGKVDVALISEDVVPHSHRQHLAAIKHSDQVIAAAPADSPVLLCSDRDCIEAVFVGDVERDSVAEIRIPKAEYERLWVIAFDSFDPKASEEKRALGNDFVELLSGARKHSIALIEV